MLITEGALFILIFMSLHICDLTSSYFTPHAEVARSMVRKVLRPPLPTSLQPGSSLSAAWTIPKKGSLVSTLEKILLVCVCARQYEILERLAWPRGSDIRSADLSGFSPPRVGRLGETKPRKVHKQSGIWQAGKATTLLRTIKQNRLISLHREIVKKFDRNTFA